MQTNDEQPTRVITHHYGPGVIIGVAADNQDDILVKLDTATSYGSQTVGQARSEVEAAASSISAILTRSARLGERAILASLDLTGDLMRHWARAPFGADHGAVFDLIARRVQGGSPPGFPDEDNDGPGEDNPPPECTACGTTDYVPSSIRPGVCISCSNARFFGYGSRFEAERFARPLRAATLQSIEIERRLFVCPNCQGIHHVQQCPELHAALFAEEPAIAVYETHEMVRLWSVSRTLLVAKLRKLTRPQLVCQAVAFAAWLDERTQAGLSAASVLHIWETMLDDGPAAPAMQVAA